MYSPQYSSPENYTHPEPTGPRERIPRRWLRLFVRAFVLVGLLAGSGTLNRHWWQDDSAPAPAPATAPTGTAPTKAECRAVKDAYTRWMSTGVPVTQEQFGALDASTANAAVKAGRNLLADLYGYPSYEISILQSSTENYVDTMRALEEALGKEASVQEQAMAAHDAAVSLHQTYSSFDDQYCL